MIYKHLPNETEIDLAPYTSRHTGDRTEAYKYFDGEPINLSFYFPEGYDRAKKYPLFIFIHGGGWSSHKIFDDQTQWSGDYLGYLARYYADRGFVSVSVDYRLSSPDGQAENRQVIDCCDDCFDAIDYILDRCCEYGLDKDNVYILGESAGGHLAAFVTTRYKRKGFNFKASFLVNAITDMVSDSWNKRVPLNSSHPALAKMNFRERAEYLSPVCAADSGVCPVVLIHGADDNCVSIKQSYRFHEKLVSKSKPCELHEIANTSHAFLLAEYTNNIAACKTGIGIIDEFLKTDIRG